MSKLGSIPAIAACAALSFAAAPVLADHGAAVTATTTVTNVAANIVQLNYNERGAVDGFVVSGNVLLSFPGRVCGGASSLGAVGQAVTYSGTSRTNSTSGMQAVRVSAYTNTASSATYTAPAAPTATAYPATAGTLLRLNFDESGSIDGFLFTATGATAPVLVSFGGPLRNTTLSPLLVVGAAVTVTGNTWTEPSCTTTALSTVRATSLLLNGTTYSFHNRGR